MLEPLNPSGSALGGLWNSQISQFMAIFGYFEPFWSPPMAMSEGKKGSNTSVRVSPALIQPWSSLIQPFGVPRADYGPIFPIYGNLGLFWALLEPPDGNVRREKRFQHISLGVTCLDPTLIHLDPAIWGPQGRLWPNFPNLWHYGAILSPSGAPRRQCQKGKKVPTHQPGCHQPWSNLDPPWSSHLGSPGLFMARNGIFGQKMALFGHKYYPKCWKSMGTHWITILHHQTDQKSAKVVSK